MIRRSAFAAACLAALAYCAPASAATFNTLTGAAPVVIGHRGAAAYLPENSLGGYELAARQGADHVETDVHLSKDGVAVVMHDSTLERTTNVAELFAKRNGGYRVADFTVAEIQSLTTRPSGPAGTSYPGFSPSVLNPYKVPTLSQFLDAVKQVRAQTGKQLGVVIEVKGAYDPAMNRQVVDTVVAKGLTKAEDRVVLQSFSFQNTQEMARLAREAGIAATASQLGGANLLGTEFVVAINASTYRRLDEMAGYLDSVGVFNGLALSRAFVNAAHELGLGVNVWTLRPLTQALAFLQINPLIDMGVDGIITDYPDFARAVVDARLPAPVPLPATLPLAAVALAGLAGVARAARRG